MLQWERPSVPRRLVWVEGREIAGWGCSDCIWVFSPPGAASGKSLDEMPRNYQLQLSADFAFHHCTANAEVKEA